MKNEAAIEILTAIHENRPRRWWQRKTYTQPAPAPTLLMVEEIK